MKITLCVSVPDNGLVMLRNHVESAMELASGEHEITLDFTYNSETERDRIVNAQLPVTLGKSHFVPFETRLKIHSDCINALYKGVDADVALICDYDTAFVAKNWDKTLVDIIIHRGVGFFGSPYSATEARPKVTFGEQKILCLKYQEKPNAIFLAFAPARIKPLVDHICDYARCYNGPDDISVKFIATAYDSACYRIPIGSFVHLDTGYRLAEIMEEHKLSFESLVRRVDDYKVVHMPKTSADAYPTAFKPEEYDWNGAPFVVHFRKASMPESNAAAKKNIFASIRRTLLRKKKPRPPRTYQPEQFFADVKNYNRNHA